MEDFILVVEDVIPDETCNALIELGESDLAQPATVFDRDGQEGIGDVRKNSLLHLTLENCGEHLREMDNAFRKAYLNDVEQGSETEFLFQGRKVPPRKGSVVVFPSGWTHQHRALPPLSGKKFVVTSFLRFPGPFI